MEFSRVHPTHLEKATLKAEFYGREFRRAAELVGAFPRLATLDEIRRDDSPIRRGIDMPRIVDDSNSPLLVTIAAFSDPGIAFDGLERIDRTQHFAFSGSCIAQGDLLVAMGGYVGAAAIVPADCPTANIGRHTARVVIDDQKADKYFAWAFIRSRPGTLLFAREVTGSVQAGINLEDLRLIQIPTPDRKVQQYIGDKVRQAERLRSSSQQAMRLAQQLIEALISKAIREDDVKEVVARIGNPNDALASSFGLPTIANRNGASGRSLISRISGIALTERLDSGFYQKEFLENERHIQECGLPLHSIGTLCEKCNCGATPKEVVYEDIGQGLIRTTDVRPNIFLADQVLRTSRIKVSATSTVAAIARDIVYTMSGTIGHAAVIPDGDETFSFSNTIARARLPKNSEHDPDYVAGFFNSSFGYKQSLRLTSGGIQGHVMPNPFKGLLVPTPSPTVQRFIGDLFRKANRLERFAGKLVTAAKELVTALIENHVTEADLETAQQSLEQGNQELDRAILSRLTTGGIDVANKPRLFADLDALYAAVDEAHRTQPNNGDDS